MPYIGTNPTNRFSSVEYQDLTGVSGSPAKRGFTLNTAVGSANDLEVFVNNVRQEPSVAYTVSGTTLTMTGDVETTDDFYVVFQGKAIGTATLPSGASLQAASGTFSSTFTATAGASTNALSLQSSNFKMTDLTTNAFYRTGTFTPFFGGSGASTAYTVDIFSAYVTQAGSYVRIGDLVHASVFLKIDYSATSYQNGGSSTDVISVGGFPFKPKNDSTYFPVTSAVSFAFDSSQGWSSYNIIGQSNTHNVNYVRLLYAGAGGTTSLIQAANVFDQSGDQAQSLDSQVIFQWTYETDEA